MPKLILESVLRFRRSKSHFLSLEIGHFWQKCPFLSGKKWDFERPNLRTDSKKPAKHPPKWLVRHLFHAFIIFGRVFGQFWKISFSEPFPSHFPLIKQAKNGFGQKGTQKWPWGLVFWLNDLQIGPTKIFWGPMKFSKCLPPPYWCPFNSSLFIWMSFCTGCFMMVLLIQSSFNSRIILRSSWSLHRQGRIFKLFHFTVTSTKTSTHNLKKIWCCLCFWFPFYLAILLFFWNEQ